jgi:hypothetical protein
MRIKYQESPIRFWEIVIGGNTVSFDPYGYLGLNGKPLNNPDLAEKIRQIEDTLSLVSLAPTCDPQAFYEISCQSTWGNIEMVRCVRERPVPDQAQMELLKEALGELEEAIKRVLAESENE